MLTVPILTTRYTTVSPHSKWRRVNFALDENLIHSTLRGMCKYKQLKNTLFYSWKTSFNVFCRASKPVRHKWVWSYIMTTVSYWIQWCILPIRKGNSAPWYHINATECPTLQPVKVPLNASTVSQCISFIASTSVSVCFLNDLEVLWKSCPFYLQSFIFCTFRSSSEGTTQIGVK